MLPCFFPPRSRDSVVFPEEWKCSKVVPLFKEGEPSDQNNYCPIPVIPVVAKVFERIVYDQFCEYLRTILCKNQTKWEISRGMFENGHY